MNIFRFISIVFALVISAPVFSQKLDVVHLTIECKENPQGIEKLSPALGWQLKSSKKAVLQTAYRVLVADDLELLKKGEGNIWDSRKIFSEQSIRVKYSGPKLIPAKTYYWKVMVWDKKGNNSGWSDISQWQMGLLSNEDWKRAEWIAYEKIPDSLVNILPTDGTKDIYKENNVLPLFRKSFMISKPVRKATMFISGLGHFEFSMNGKKIGDHFLDPGWTKYDQQALYVPFDVTKNLQTGNNAIGVMLGNGFYYIPPVSSRYRKLRVAFGYPKMICRLVIEYADGSSGDIITDASWLTSKSAITFSSIYGGEDYDANLEQQGWDQPVFDESSWSKVVIVDGPPTLNSQMIDPVKVMESFTPKKITRLSQSAWVYDMGQNASAIPQIKVQGKKGDTIRIIPAELLKATDSVTQRTSGGPHYYDYVLKGDGIETWQPRFSYYGFRYIQVQGAVPMDSANLSQLPVLLGVTSLHVRNAAKQTGSFKSSSDLFNRTYGLVDWAIRSNTMSVFTDCPHREKLGWLEQLHLMGVSVQYNYDVVQLFKKQMKDMQYSQTEEGLIPEIAPEYVKFDWGNGMFRDSPEWGSASIIVPWYLYQWYGDKDVLEESYGMMTRYEAYLRNKAKGYILSQGLGDWYDLGPNAPGVSQLTPMGVTGTAIYYYDLNILSKVSGLLGKHKEALEYNELALHVRKAFNDTFFHAETKQYASGSQSANAMAVYMGLVDPQYKQAVIDNIIKDIRNRNNSLTAGDIGYRYLLCVLHEAGRDDVIYDMNSRVDVPGYGYQLAKGATALTESWAALPTASNNHFMLGHLMEWFYTGLLGIELPENSLAYKQFVVRPAVVGDIQWSKGEMMTPYGVIGSQWKKKKNKFRLTVTIPANTTACIDLPHGTKVRQGGFLFKKNPGRINTGCLDFKNMEAHVGSGTYTFYVKTK